MYFFCYNGNSLSPIPPLKWKKTSVFVHHFYFALVRRMTNSPKFPTVHFFVFRVHWSFKGTLPGQGKGFGLAAQFPRAISGFFRLFKCWFDIFISKTCVFSLLLGQISVPKKEMVFGIQLGKSMYWKQVGLVSQTGQNSHSKDFEFFWLQILFFWGGGKSAGQNQVLSKKPHHNFVLFLFAFCQGVVFWFLQSLLKSAHPVFPALKDS